MGFIVGLKGTVYTGELSLYSYNVRQKFFSILLLQLQVLLTTMNLQRKTKYLLSIKQQTGEY